MGAPNLLADNMEYGLSYSVVSYLKKLSQQVSITCSSFADTFCAIFASTAKGVPCWNKNTTSEGGKGECFHVKQTKCH